MIPRTIGHIRVPAALALVWSLAAPASAQFTPADRVGPEAPVAATPYLVVPLGVQTATLAATGEEVEFPFEEVWKPVCSTPHGAVTAADLAVMFATHTADLADPAQVTILDGGASPEAGLNIVFQLGPSVPAAAVPAFAAAEAYLESQFPNDPITVTISVSFAALSPGVIGGTSTTYGYASWSTSRSVLVSGADASDTIQAFLPSGSTIPVRYSSSATPTNEDRVFWAFANWKAAGGTVTGNDASMQFSTNFPFDYDPSDGVSASTMSLQDVIVHETGHALGFTSGIDFRSRDIETLDVFRFQRTDGSADYNPDTNAEFQVRPRLARWNAPNDDHNFDIIDVEYRMSDGSPYQASHFREQVPAIGIMDPAFNYGETFYPNFFRTSDLTAFDAIGYDR